MILKVIGTGSQGNAYLLENEQTALLIECGVRADRIKKALGFQVGKLAGCLLSHEHKDHSLAAKQVLNMGCYIYASYGTHQACGTAEHHRARFVHADKTIQVGPFQVLPFKLEHDAADPLGFLIHHPQTGVVLFLTDSLFSQYTFTGLNNIIIEANYDRRILDSGTLNGTTHGRVRDRVLNNHMSLDACTELLGATDLTAVNHIVLIHLSDTNSDAHKFKEQIKETTGKTVHIATSGLSIKGFNKTPFE